MFLILSVKEACVAAGIRMNCSTSLSLSDWVILVYSDECRVAIGDGKTIVFIIKAELSLFA